MESKQVRGHPLFAVESGLYEGGMQQKPSQMDRAHPCRGTLCYASFLGLRLQSAVEVTLED